MLYENLINKATEIIEVHNTHVDEKIDVELFKKKEST